MPTSKPALLLLLALYFLVTLAFSGFEATFALFSERGSASPPRPSASCSPSSASCWRSCRACWSAGSSSASASAADSAGDLCLIALGLGLVPFVWNVPTLLVALGVLAVGMGFNSPSLSSMVSRLADPNDQGGILGLASSLASLGRVVGPAWGGYLYDAYGMTTPYLSAAALMLVAFAVSFVGLRSTDARAGRCRRRTMTPTFLHAANPGPITGDGNWTYLIGDRRRC